MEKSKNMKFKSKIATIGSVALALLGLSACSNKQQQSSSTKIPTKITKKTTVTFWYSLTGTSKSALEKLTADFPITEELADYYSSISRLALQCC